MPEPLSAPNPTTHAATDPWPGVDLANLRAQGAAAWSWPAETQFVFQDLHADVEAFGDSLAAAGVLDSAGGLTDAGAAGTVVIGGDTFDKGDSTLGLLETIEALRERGARVAVLAGNHDVRNRIGFMHLGADAVETAHLFVRTCPKSIPLLADVHRRFLAGGEAPRLSEAEARRQIVPGPAWFAAWPEAVADQLPPGRVEKDLIRLREKLAELEPALAAHGLGFAALHQAAEHTRALLAPGGRWGWYFDGMNLARQVGSFLIVHAGIGDRAAALVAERGVAGLNERFRHLLEHDPYTLYHGPIGNVFRTKYRDGVDLPLTPAGTAALRGAGVRALVHGHTALPGGPRLELRAGLLHVAAHALVDRNSRRLAGLTDTGRAAIVIEPTRLVGLHGDQPARVLTRAELEGTSGS